MIQTADVKVVWKKGAYDKITKEIPDNIMYGIARETLDLTEPTIPTRTGKMKQTSLAKGVQGGNGNYRIGSYTDYAAYVYVMPQSTSWTTPGTNAQWFNKVWQTSGKSIVDTVVERNKLK